MNSPTTSSVYKERLLGMVKSYVTGASKQRAKAREEALEDAAEGAKLKQKSTASGMANRELDRSTRTDKEKRTPPAST